MTAIKYIALLTITMLISFWRLTPWTWAARLAQMPGALWDLMLLDPEARLTSIQGAVVYLETARKDDLVWMPECIYKRIQALAVGQ